MRLITVRQPWAWAIVHGTKRVENRAAGFPANYRGQVFIHASASWSERGRRDERVDNAYRAVLGKPERGPYDSLVIPKPDRVAGLLVHPTVAWPDERLHIDMATVIGVAELVDVHHDAECCRPWGESEYVASDQRLHRGVNHLVLEDVRALPHGGVYAKGRLGLWKPDPDLAWNLEAALEQLDMEAQR